MVPAGLRGMAQPSSQVSASLEKNKGSLPSAAKGPRDLTVPCSPGKLDLDTGTLFVMESGGVA